MYTLLQILHLFSICQDLHLFLLSSFGTMSGKHFNFHLIVSMESVVKDIQPPELTGKKKSQLPAPALIE